MTRPCFHSVNRDDEPKTGTGKCLGHGANPAQSDENVDLLPPRNDVLKLKPILEKQEQDAVKGELLLASPTFHAGVISRATHSANITYEHRLTWILPEGVSRMEY